jgi:hypothetical protein
METIPFTIASKKIKHLANIFSHSVDGLFNLKTISFVEQKLFSFMKSHLSMLSLSCRAAGVLLRKFLPILINSKVFPTLEFGV